MSRHQVTEDVVKHAQVHGYRTVFWVAAGALLVAPFMVSVLVRQPQAVATDHPAVAASRD